MTAATKPLLALTAGDLMALDLLVIPEDIPMRSAAQLLLNHEISGAPVVDLAGKLVGVISTTDFMRPSQTPLSSKFASSQRPVGCSYQTWSRDRNGRDFAFCNLQTGVCSVQRPYRDATGKQRVVCSEPNCVATDSQLAMIESVSAYAVKYFMTRNVVTTVSTTPIKELGRMMMEAGIHLVIVVGADRTPLGVVTGTDIISAVAREKDPRLGPRETLRDRAWERVGDNKTFATALQMA